MSFPLFMTAAKNYPVGVGESLLPFLEIHRRLAEELGVHLTVAVNPIDLKWAAQQTDLPLAAQHVDAIDYGSHTGWIHPAAVAQSGVTRTLLNHSEHRLASDTVQDHVEKAIQNGLSVVLCAESESEVGEFAQMIQAMEQGPRMVSIAYEPPEYIGSADKSVASENPDIIQKSIEKAGDIPLLIGAGINSVDDITVGLQLGAQGFLVASAVCKAEDPEEKLRELLEPLRGS